MPALVFRQRHPNVMILLLGRKRSTVSVLVILIFFSILVAGSFLAAFIWSVRSGQYDDDYTPSVRILFDDQPSSSSDSNSDHTPTSIKQNGNNAS